MQMSWVHLIIGSRSAINLHEAAGGMGIWTVLFLSSHKNHKRYYEGGSPFQDLRNHLGEKNETVKPNLFILLVVSFAGQKLFSLIHSHVFCSPLPYNLNDVWNLMNNINWGTKQNHRHGCMEQMVVASEGFRETGCKEVKGWTNTQAQLSHRHRPQCGDGQKERGWGRWRWAIGEHGEGEKLCLGDGRAMQWAGTVLLSCTLAACMVLWSNTWHPNTFNIKKPNLFLC